ncbi:endonuclease/exonuclease/phosphatase family protein [Glaciimonas soli]|uniref:Endonuclease n=1 Tax=Glaciimonas soli TaxID=2590999 RepID=A0A843YSJ9_9BURK|nr:endonuclease/exonuclease/phosphatase family protein [Glaciimonas soli]MQR00331.1 endonuclease [Glaciimonas soli]
MKIRIATYNIHKGVSSFGSRPRVHALKQALTQMEADVFFLQEVQGRHDLHAARHTAHWPEQSQQDFLAGDSHHAAYGMNAVYDHGHHGNALLSRFPIGSSRNQDVSDHAYEARGILHCVLQTPKGDIHCYVVHLGLFGGGRKRQTAALIEAVRSSAPPDAPVIIAGDFNDWGNRLSEMLCARLHVTEIFDENLSKPSIADYMNTITNPESRTVPGVLSGLAANIKASLKLSIKPARTFPAMLPWLRLDRIYTRGFTVESAEVLHGPAWAKLSDHAPIVAMLELKS